jgi:cytochrome c-type biogenesis protein CcmH
MKKIPILLLCCWLSVGQAAIETYQFEDPSKEAEYKQLVQELRCTVCQNQNIADSNAELAGDLRRKTYEMVQQGKSPEEIKQFMVERYGNFVLYNPPVQTNTLLLWGGPFVIFVVGLAILIHIIRRRPSTEEHLLSEEERKRAEALLARGTDEEK